VDVYDNGIMLKGRDFTAGKYLPIATYWLDTSLKTVEAGTYRDLTGTIDTNNILTINYIHNYTVSSTTGELSESQGQSSTELIDIESGYGYILDTTDGRKDTGTSCYVVCFDSAGTCIGRTANLLDSGETEDPLPLFIPFLSGSASFRLRCFRNKMSESAFEDYLIIKKSIVS
jgi:hypothetical protein